MARQLSPEAESTRNSLEYVGAGAGLMGASFATDAVVNADRKRRKMDGPIRAAVKGKFTRRHAGQVGAKVAGRAAFAAGAPLAAYGAYTALKPKEPTPRMNVKRDVVKPVASNLALKDLRDQQADRVGKADLSQVDQKRLVRRKKLGRDLSIVGGTLGLAALGLRAPEAARALTKVPKLNRTPLKQLATKEPAATKASNTLGIAAIGSGAAGSFNYASQQKLEAKQFQKSLPTEGVIRGIGKVRVLGQHSKDHFMVLDNRDTRRLVNRSRLTFTGGKKKPKTAEQMTLPFGKSDRFLRRYADRISPEAEAGYKYLKRGRNEGAAQAAVGTAAGGLTAAATGMALRDAKRLGLKRPGGRLSAVLAGAGAGLTAWNAHAAVQGGKKAVRWNSKLKRIEATAKEREALGQYGRGRVEKALKLPAGVLKPLAPKLTKPSVNRSYVATSVSGKKFTVRGSVR